MYNTYNYMYIYLYTCNILYSATLVVMVGSLFRGLRTDGLEARGPCHPTLTYASRSQEIAAR